MSMKAVIVANWIYSTDDYSNLVDPPNDLTLMQKLLQEGGYQNIIPLENTEDIEQEIKKLIEKQDGPLERFHFHYSGHGTRNITVQFDKNNFSRKLTEAGFETVNAAKQDSVTGDCMIGSSGQLYTVDQLKYDLLQLDCSSLTVTLDMCRDENRGGNKPTLVRPLDSIRKVELPPALRIADKDLQRIAIFYGTSELHTARDHHSFTCMLDTVLRRNFLHLPFLEISRKVNENWNEQNIKQKSKVDCVEVGNNWKNFYWPSKLAVHENATKNSSFDDDQNLIHRDSYSEARRRTSNQAVLLSAIDSLKFTLPRAIQKSGIETVQDVEKVSTFFTTIKESFIKLETTSYKTAMMLFYDLMKKLENGIFPSVSEVRDVNLEATKAWNMCGDKNLEEKMKMSKIRLFCKNYEILFDEKSKTFKQVESLEDNEQEYLSEFLNSEIAKLEEISSHKISSMMKRGTTFNIKKCQNFIDEIDQIKRVSYSTIKKEDFAFEHNGKISKYWTLNKNMVTEGEDDSLKAIDCTFISPDNKTVTLQFTVFSDLFSNWRVQISASEPISSSLSLSLCAVEGDSSVPANRSVYIPMLSKDDTSDRRKVWNLDMKHLKYPEKEVTLIFSFVGTMNTPLCKIADSLNTSVLKTVVEEDLSLIKKINELSLEDTTGYSVSLTMVVCNFLKEPMEISEPYFTSGTVDTTRPWVKNIKPSSVDILYTRKHSIEARGSVGLTVITVPNCLNQGMDGTLQPLSFAVHWNAPWDFNLFENSFAVFPLPSQKVTSEDVTRDYKTFINYFNISKVHEKYIGIRGYAKDGPKSLEYRGVLISAMMGVKHNDVLQISVLPLKQNMGS